MLGAKGIVQRLGSGIGIDWIVFSEEAIDPGRKLGERFDLFLHKGEDGVERARGIAWDAGFPEERNAELAEALDGHVGQIESIEPGAFIEVKVGVLAVDLFEFEKGDDFLDVEFLAVVLRGPAEHTEVVADGLRSVTGVEVGGDAGSLVAFAHFGAILVEDEWNVGVTRRGSPEDFEEFEVLGGVGEMVFAANDVGDLHFDVIDDIHEMENPRAVWAADGHVRVGGGIGEVEIDAAADEVMDGDDLARGAETPGALVLVEMSSGAEFLEVAFVNGLALGLKIGAEGSVFFWALVPIESEPAEAVEDDLDGLRGVACLVGVLDAQDERTAAVARVEPVEEGGASPAHVEVTGGRRGKADADLRIHTGGQPCKRGGGGASKKRAVGVGACEEDGTGLDPNGGETRVAGCPAALRPADTPVMFHKILVIDDHLAAARLAESVLAQRFSGAPVDVLVAQRGLDAFDRIQGAQPDLIVLSDALPDLKAEAVCLRLLSDPMTARVPVYLVNATGEADAVEERYPNVRRILQRPIGRETMTEILSQLVAQPPPVRPGARDQLFYDQARAAFSGHTGFFQVQAALQMASGDRLTGVLRFFVNRAPIELYVNRGRFVFASTRNYGVYCRESSVVLERASLGQLMEAQQAQAVSGCPLFLYLAMRGVIANEDVVPMVREHGHRLFSALWTLGRIPFEFERMDVLPEFAAKFPAASEDADNWVLLALRHAKLERLPAGLRVDPNGSPVYTRRGAELIQRLKLTEAEARFASAVNGAESLFSLAKRTGCGMPEALALVFRFTTLGVMDYWAGQAVPGAALALPLNRK